MACTSTESKVNFITEQPLFNYSFQYGYPTGTAVGFIPVCNKQISVTNPVTLHSIEIDGTTYTIEQTFTDPFVYYNFLNSYVNVNIESYTIRVTNPCGVTYSAKYNISNTALLPFTLTSYVKDGVTYTVNQTFTTQAEFDTFMAGLGWTKSSSGKTGNFYYVISSAVTWGEFKFAGTYPLIFTGVPIVESFSAQSSAIEKSNTIERCATSYGFLETTCIWGVTGVSYRYWALLTLSDPDSFLGGFFPQTGVEFTVDGVTTSKDFDDVTEFLDYMASEGWLVQNQDGLLFLFDVTQQGWSSIVFTSGDITVEIQQYISKLDLEPTCTERKIYSKTPPKKVIHPFIETLTCKVQENITKIACQEIAWRQIGKPTKDLYRKRVINLNAMFLIDLGGLTTEQANTIDCFVEANAKP